MKLDIKETVCECGPDLSDAGHDPSASLLGRNKWIYILISG
jgi:hypothetical protein